MFINHTTIMSPHENNFKPQPTVTPWSWTLQKHFFFRIYSCTAAGKKKINSKQCPRGSSAPDRAQRSGVFAQMLCRALRQMGHFIPNLPAPPEQPSLFFSCSSLFLLQDLNWLQFWQFSLHPWTSWPTRYGLLGLSAFISHPPPFFAGAFLSSSYSCPLFSENGTLPAFLSCQNPKVKQKWTHSPHPSSFLVQILPTSLLCLIHPAALDMLHLTLPLQLVIKVLAPHGGNFHLSSPVPVNSASLSLLLFLSFPSLKHHFFSRKCIRAVFSPSLQAAGLPEPPHLGAPSPAQNSHLWVTPVGTLQHHFS